MNPVAASPSLALSNVVLRPNAAIVATVPSARSRTAVRVVVALAILAGMSFRVAVYLRNPSFWIDESMLAVNVVERSFAQLLEPLEFNQGAPVGFLLASKAMTLFFGDSELSLRLIPLLASLVSVVVFSILAYRVLPIVPARVAIGLYLFSPYLIGYSAEFKQYSVDACVTVVLLWCGARIINGNQRRDYLVLAIAGAVAVWWSHPATFVLGAIGCVLAIDALRQRNRERVVMSACTIAMWSISFAVVYLLFVRKLGSNAYLLDYWAGNFMPLPPRHLSDLSWFGQAFFQLFDRPGGFHGEYGLAGLAAFSFVVGVRQLARADWRICAMVLLPFAFALVASGLHRYPFSGRLMLFAVPLLILAVANGATELMRILNRNTPHTGTVFLLMLALGPILECKERARLPLHREDARAIFDRLAQDYRPGDKVYLFFGAVPSARYYLRGTDMPIEQFIHGGEHRARDPQRLAEEFQPLLGSPRVWVVLTHHLSAEDAAIRAILDRNGQGSVVASGSDAVLLRYDLSRPLRPTPGQ